MSFTTKLKMFGGTTADQTLKGKEDLASLARAWATWLPCRLIWMTE